MIDLFTSSTYSWDLELFRELGLKPFRDVPTWERVEVGRVELDDGAWVNVTVSCAPAQFWTFVIRQADKPDRRGRHMKMSTGSGSFGDYWPFVRALVDSVKAADEIGFKKARRQGMASIEWLSEARARRAVGELVLGKEGPRIRPSVLAG